MRHEITVQTEAEIPSIITLLKNHQVKKINLTHKSTDIANLEAAILLRENIPDLDITLHCSMKYHNQQSFKTFVENCLEVDLNKILLISGSPKPHYDSIQALNDLTIFPELEIYCAHNPYLSSDKQQVEDLRLNEKVNSNNVKGIYLQIGIDNNKLSEAIQLIKSLYPKQTLFGSLLIPTPAILKRFKDNPIKEITLSNEYLQNVDFALEKTKEILAIYKENKITPLIENIPFTDFSVLPSLLSLI